MSAYRHSKIKSRFRNGAPSSFPYDSGEITVQHGGPDPQFHKHSSFIYTPIDLEGYFFVSIIYL